MSRILIADDEARIRRLVSDFLKRDGHSILEAADGREALQMIENRQSGLDLAILDVMMPGMDGFEVLRALRAQESGDKHLPVMMLTARAEDCLLYTSRKTGRAHAPPRRRLDRQGRAVYRRARGRAARGFPAGARAGKGA